MEFKTMETNKGRAARMGLQPAPTLKGYFFNRKDCLDMLEKNIAATANGGPPEFRLLFLETVDACNLKCPMCYTNAQPKNVAVKNEFLEWNAALVAAKGAGVRTVAVAGKGEPLMDPDFFRLADAVRGHGMEFLTFTNGTLVTPGMAKQLEGTCDTVITKMFGLTPKVNDVLVGVKGEHVRMRRAVANLLDAGLDGPRLGIDAVVAKQNEAELDNLLRMCRMFNIVPYFEKLAFMGKAANANANICLNDKEALAVFERLRKIDEAEFGFTWAIPEGATWLALAHGETDKRALALHMDVYGNVVPGLATGKAIGNIRGRPGGIAAIMQDAPAWNAYYADLAKELGVQGKVATAAATAGTPVALQTHQFDFAQGIIAAAEEFGKMFAKAKAKHEDECRCELFEKNFNDALKKHDQFCGCGNFANNFGERFRVPAYTLNLVADIEKAAAGTPLEDAMPKIKELALDENPIRRKFGHMLLIDAVHGRRHAHFCDKDDLTKHEWEAQGRGAHEAKDPLMHKLGERALDVLKEDVTAFRLTWDCLGIALQNRLWAAAVNLAYIGMIYTEHPKTTKDGIREAAAAMDKALERNLGKGGPTFWCYLYEVCAGKKDVAYEPQHFAVAKKYAAIELGNMLAGLREQGDPIAYLQANAECAFIGANDLAALAGYLYADAKRDGDAKLAENALETLELLCRDEVLRGKIMRKKGILKEALVERLGGDEDRAM